MKGVELALFILSDYYAKADKSHGSSGGAGRGISGMLEVIESDFTEGIIGGQALPRSALSPSSPWGSPTARAVSIKPGHARRG